MTTAFLLVLITSLALKSTCSAVWVVQVISRQLSKWKLILSTLLHHPDSSSNTGRKINKNKNINKALTFEVLQLEILSQCINMVAAILSSAKCSCSVLLLSLSKQIGKRIMPPSWASRQFTTWCRPLRRLMADSTQGCIERMLYVSLLLLEKGDSVWWC